MVVFKNKYGQYHREDGPAIEYADGHKEWFINGLLHRIDGPAIEFKSGAKHWWILHFYFDKRPILKDIFIVFSLNKNKKRGFI